MDQVLSGPTATGVDPRLRIAGPGARSYAFIIDWHIRLLAALAWLLIGTLATVGRLDAGLADPLPGFIEVTVLPAAAIYFLYHPIVELVMGGGTPGKRIAGVRVVRTDGTPPGAGAIGVRNLLRLIDSLPVAYFVGLACTLLTERQVRLGDIAAGTVLVYTEAPDDAPAQVADGDTHGRAGEDAHVLARAEQRALVRDLLDRWASLRPATRQALARKLLTRFDALPENASDEELRSALDALAHHSAAAIRASRSEPS